MTSAETRGIPLREDHHYGGDLWLRETTEDDFALEWQAYHRGGVTLELSREELERLVAAATELLAKQAIEKPWTVDF